MTTSVETPTKIYRSPTPPVKHMQVYKSDNMKDYRYFKTVGYYSPDRKKGDKLVVAKELTWKKMAGTNRLWAILMVIEFINKGKTKVKGIKAHYIWKFDNTPDEDYPCGELWAEKVYIKEVAFTKAV